MLRDPAFLCRMSGSGLLVSRSTDPAVTSVLPARFDPRLCKERLEPSEPFRARLDMSWLDRSLEERMVVQCLRYDSGGKEGLLST